jgi:type I restriction enzyme M protein
MHGDGHGGVHHHDGFLNVNGIFEGRFDIILTNPPFGANVEPSDKVLRAQTEVPPAEERRHVEHFGELYRQAMQRTRAAVGKPIASLFQLPKGRKSKTKTEILFIERCLELLRPGGRLGIVLPEGVLNNPSLAYVREFCEDRAFIRAVVSLPQDTFVSSGASVKASLLFMQKFTQDDRADFEAKKAAADAQVQDKYAAELAAEEGRLTQALEQAKKDKDAHRRKELEADLRLYKRDMEKKIHAEARALLKERFTYPVFLYEAEHVGITATGETEHVANELVPGDHVPEAVEKTALELYWEFREDPDAFLGMGTGT